MRTRDAAVALSAFAHAHEAARRSSSAANVATRRTTQCREVGRLHRDDRWEVRRDCWSLKCRREDGLDSALRGVSIA